MFVLDMVTFPSLFAVYVCAFVCMCMCVCVCVCCKGSEGVCAVLYSQWFKGSKLDTFVASLICITR